MFCNWEFGVKQILWSIHLCVSLFQTFSIYSWSPGLLLPCRNTEIQIWLAEVNKTELLSIENPNYCTLIGRRKCFWWWHKSLSSSSLGAWQRRYQKGSHCFTVTERVLHPSQERDLQLRWNYKDGDHLWCLSLSDTQFTVTEWLSVPRACSVKQTIGRSNSAERLPSCPGRRD